MSSSFCTLDDYNTHAEYIRSVCAKTPPKLIKSTHLAQVRPSKQLCVSHWFFTVSFRITQSVQVRTSWVVGFAPSPPPPHTHTHTHKIYKTNLGPKSSIVNLGSVCEETGSRCLNGSEQTLVVFQPLFQTQVKASLG